MSVLSFPHIYFKGYMGWDPCTFNNNDWQEFPTYDPFRAALNRDFLKTPNPPITQQNFTTAFRPWAVALQQDTVDTPQGPRVPAEWNMFGGHGVSFVAHDKYATTVTGGDLGYDNPVTSDPLIGGPVSINGDGGTGRVGSAQAELTAPVRNVGERWKVNDEYFRLPARQL